MTGQTVTYTATVSVSAPGSGSPTGFVEFFDGGTPISACAGTTGEPLTGTTATCSVTYAAVGSHTITVKYLGDANFNQSAGSSAITQVVQKASTSTTVASTTGSPSVVGQQVTYTATVSVTAEGGGGTPTGNIEFFDGGTPIAVCAAGTGRPLSGLNATCQVTYSAIGSHTITAQYLGDTNYNASASSASITQVVNQASTTTGLASSANPSVAGQQVTYTATVSVTAPGSGTPTGSVTFKDGASTISCATGSVTFNGTTATCKVTYATVTGSARTRSRRSTTATRTSPARPRRRRARL